MDSLDEAGIQHAFLCELYCLFVDDEVEVDEIVGFRDVLERCRRVMDGHAKIGRNLAHFAMKAAEADEHIEVFEEEYGPNNVKVKITYKGLQYVKRSLNSGDGICASYYVWRRNSEFSQQAADNDFEYDPEPETIGAELDE